MAINKNHEFEELDGVKCSIVEKAATAERVHFLKNLLTTNGFIVVVVSNTPPKAISSATENIDVPTVASLEDDTNKAYSVPENVVETFKVGVTDYTFNATNAIFGRALKTSNGKIVTQAYWLQKEQENEEEIPYYNFK